MEAAEQSERITELLGQLEAAGASIIEMKGDPPDREMFAKGNRLTDATLQGIWKAADIDFTAWVAWTLRF